MGLDHFCATQKDARSLRLWFALSDLKGSRVSQAHRRVSERMHRKTQARLSIVVLQPFGPTGRLPYIQLDECHSLPGKVKDGGLAGRDTISTRRNELT